MNDADPGGDIIGKKKRCIMIDTLLSGSPVRRVSYIVYGFCFSFFVSQNELADKKYFPR